jgi:hypothetical protein
MSQALLEDGQGRAWPGMLDGLWLSLSVFNVATDGQGHIWMHNALAHF